MYELLERRLCLSTRAFLAHEMHNQPVTDTPEFVQIADMDGDGDFDVLSASGGDGKIAWSENADGRGTFTRQHVIGYQDPFGSHVRAGDIDGDGDTDVVAANGRLELVWFENVVGQATTWTRSKISGNAGASIFLADIDGDEDLDVATVVGQYTDQRKIGWYENDGTGNFSRVHVFDSAASVSVHVADFDQDGDADIVSETTGGKRELVWHENLDGNGNFGPPRAVTGLRPVWSMDVADVNGDGTNDVLAAIGTSAGGSLVWFAYEQNSQSGFSDRRIVASVPGSPWSLQAADFDSDGDMDIVAGFNDETRNTAHVAWFENTDGRGNFGPARIVNSQEFEPGHGCCNLFRVRAEDLSGDNVPDIVAIAYKSETISWYKNIDGGRTFENEQTVTGRPVRLQSVSAADLDNDGDLDVLAATADYIAWYENQQRGSFGGRQVIWFNPSTVVHGPTQGIEREPGTDLQAVDIDADGDLDVLVAEWDRQEFGWHENLDGHGELGPLRVIDATSEPGPFNQKFFFSAFGGDVDGDGDTDAISIHTLCFGGCMTSTVSWHENLDGRGSFGPGQVIVADVDSARVVRGADLDADGDLDVVTASARDGNITWYANEDSRGTFVKREVLPISNGDTFYSYDFATALEITDADRDGDLDLFAAIAEDTVDWYENLGSGRFGRRSSLATDAPGLIPEGTVLSLRVADMDDDNDNDLVFASARFPGIRHGTISWFEGINGQRFGARQPVSRVDVFARAVDVGDLDGDGDLDVVSAFEGQSLAWYENRLAGDVDDDGEVDFGDFLILASNFGAVDAVWSDGDFTTDGIVTFEDFLALSLNFGN